MVEHTCESFSPLCVTAFIFFDMHRGQVLSLGRARPRDLGWRQA